jgi:hypothetical protein
MSGGFNSQILGKKVAAIFGVNYTRNNRFTKLANHGYAFPEPNTGGTVTTEFEYNDDRYSQDVVLAAWQILQHNLTLIIKFLEGIVQCQYN